MKVSTVIHTWDKALDLIIASNLVSEKVTKYYFESNLHVTSDYKTILTCLKIGNPNSKKTSQCRFQLDKIYKKQFISNLEVQKNLIQSTLAQA